MTLANNPLGIASFEPKPSPTVPSELPPLSHALVEKPSAPANPGQPVRTAERTIRLYIKLRHAQWLKDRRMFGSAINAEIVRLVLAGWLEDKPYDVSSLSAAMDDLSRQQVGRRVECLQGLGWVRVERVRNRLIVWPTEKLIDAVTVEMLARLTEGVIV